MVLQSKPKVKIISLPNTWFPFGEEQKGQGGSYVRGKKARSQRGGASCVVGGTKSVRVVIIRKSITTAATLQPLLIVRTFDNLVIGQSITRNRFFAFVVCFLLVALPAPILPESVLAKKTDERSDAELFGKGSDIWRMKKGFWDFPALICRLPRTVASHSCFLPFPDFPSLPVITILAPTPQHRDQV